MDGVINIFKEKGYTSHDVVAVVRKIMNQKKVGHTGTLDPEAEGVLPVCLGRATKLADYIMAEKKTYRTELTLGVTTTTQDHMGEVISESPVVFDEDAIRSAILQFVGEYDQLPPMYSAIKVNGRKLCDLARTGVEIERKTRRITIFDITIIEFMPPNKVSMDVFCSKGTYIRTLCADIGEKLGCGGHMSSLIRTVSGRFSVENSITLGDLKVLAEAGNAESVVMPMSQVLSGYKKITISEKGTKLLHNGCRMYDYFFEPPYDDLKIGDIVLAYDSEGVFVGIYSLIMDGSKGRLCIKPLRLLLN